MYLPPCVGVWILTHLTQLTAPTHCPSSTTKPGRRPVVDYLAWRSRSEPPTCISTAHLLVSQPFVSVPRTTVVAMPPLLPTSRAVAAAVIHHRELRQLTREELSCLLAGLGHKIGPAGLRDIEQGQTVTTVDDLVALAVALDVSPSVLLSHMPSDYPGSGRLGTGVPGDVDQPELQGWVQGRTGLDRESRLRWSRDRVQRLEILLAHHEEQYRGALGELEDLGELALQEADARPVIAIHRRAEASRQAMTRAETALAYAEHQWEALQDSS